MAASRNDDVGGACSATLASSTPCDGRSCLLVSARHNSHGTQPTMSFFTRLSNREEVAIVTDPATNRARARGFGSPAMRNLGRFPTLLVFVIDHQSPLGLRMSRNARAGERVRTRAIRLVRREWSEHSQLSWSANMVTVSLGHTSGVQRARNSLCMCKSGASSTRNWRWVLASNA